MERNLAAFDFDHTVINHNSDVAVVDLLDRTKIPKEVKELHKSSGWTAFMQAIFDLLHKNGITEGEIKNLVANLSEVPGMCELIRKLNGSLNFDVIIISDSNSYFIESWLECNNLKQHVLKVFTNPAYFDNNRLKIEMYHVQDSCKLSTKNLCKGQILEDFIRDQSKNNICYQKIVYCGDGLNDFCPILRLQEKDFACVRENYKCAELVKKATEGYEDEDGVFRLVKANVCIWNDGFDVICAILNDDRNCCDNNVNS